MATYLIIFVSEGFFFYILLYTVKPEGERHVYLNPIAPPNCFSSPSFKAYSTICFLGLLFCPLIDTVTYKPWSSLVTCSRLSVFFSTPISSCWNIQWHQHSGVLIPYLLCSTINFPFPVQSPTPSYYHYYFQQPRLKFLILNTRL